jgi:myo-inositol 2-dehydrogenase/D-chiro-inositol 1-dehydrogenase
MKPSQGIFCLLFLVEGVCHLSRNAELSVGLIGTGEMSRFYAHLITNHVSDVALVAVSSQDAERAERFASAFGIPRAHGRHVDVLKGLDAVIIASASDTHAALIEAAAERRVDIFCDKPLGATLPEIDAAIDVVERCGVKLATGFNRRFDPAFRAAHAKITRGEIGNPEATLVISRDPGTPTAAELNLPYRLFLGTTIHDLDMARYLMRDEVVSVAAQGSWLGSESLVAATEQIDTSTVTLRFHRGGIATIINSYRSTQGYDQRVEIHGSAGLCRIDNVTETMPGVPADAAYFVHRYAESYVAELRAFFETVRTGRWVPELATAEDGRIASLLSEAAVKSCQEQAFVCPV